MYLYIRLHFSWLLLQLKLVTVVQLHCFLVCCSALPWRRKFLAALWWLNIQHNGKFQVSVFHYVCLFWAPHCACVCVKVHIFLKCVCEWQHKVRFSWACVSLGRIVDGKMLNWNFSICSVKVFRCRPLVTVESFCHSKYCPAVSSYVVKYH